MILFCLQVSVTEDYDEDKRFEEAAEKASNLSLSFFVSTISPLIACENMLTLDQIMRLEQRVTCLQNANNVNSCATCRSNLFLSIFLKIVCFCPDS